jgi:hypothetical protein
MIERKYSKTKANANHVTWTAREVIPVVFNLDGLAADGMEFGVLRIPGAPMYCTGYRIDFGVPSGDYEIQASVALYTTRNYLVPNSTLRLDGVTLGATKIFDRPVVMPSGSMWKFRLNIEAPDDSSQFMPQGLNVTYYLRYAAGPVNTRFYALSQPELGVGFDSVGQTLVVQ